MSGADPTDPRGGDLLRAAERDPGGERVLSSEAIEELHGQHGREAIEGLRESVTMVLEVLERAAGYVERGWVERGWTQGRMAEDEEGLAVAPGNPRACRWCMSGALLAACERLGVDGADARAVRVRSLALYAAASACLGREPDRGGNWTGWAGYVTDWNNTVAVSCEQAAGKLREAAGWVRLRIETSGSEVETKLRAAAALMRQRVEKGGKE